MSSSSVVPMTSLYVTRTTGRTRDTIRPLEPRRPGGAAEGDQDSDGGVEGRPAERERHVQRGVRLDRRRLLVPVALRGGRWNEPRGARRGRPRELLLDGAQPDPEPGRERAGVGADR